MRRLYTAVMDAGQFVAEARKRAGLTQDALARRVGVSQPLVARIEGGDVDASFARTLELVRACGLDLEIHVVPLDEDAWTLVERGASLTPDERLDRMMAGVDLLQQGRGSRGEPDD
jgi:transcriptional regulator with XRE-family HTH domain